METILHLVYRTHWGGS